MKKLFLLFLVLIVSRAYGQHPTPPHYVGTDSARIWQGLHWIYSIPSPGDTLWTPMPYASTWTSTNSGFTYIWDGGSIWTKQVSGSTWDTTGIYHIGYVLTSTGNVTNPNWQVGGTNDSGITVIAPLTKSISGSNITLGITTPISVANGGTGTSTLGANGVVFGNGTGVVQVTAAGITGQVLTATTGSAPTWQGFNGKALDMNGVWTVKDTATGTIYITATSQPATPQFSYIIKATDIPSNGNANYVKRWNIGVTMAGRDTNTIIGATLNWITFYNGKAIGTVSSSSLSMVLGDYWSFASTMDSTLVNVGDSIQVYFWVSLVNGVNFQNATIYIYPQVYYANSGNGLYSIGQTSTAGGTYNSDTIKSGTIAVGVVTVMVTTVVVWDSTILGNSGLTTIYANNTCTPNNILPFGTAPFFTDVKNTNNFSSSASFTQLTAMAIKFFRYYMLTQL